MSSNKVVAMLFITMVVMFTSVSAGGDKVCFNDCHGKCMAVKDATEDQCYEQCAPLCQDYTRK
ncbi:hypothetical protein RND81_09G018600 [Saponaria officinalis]|uniref:Uncharacterized protein n=1 Tax=Saponaria officinalis TaxID=3572 RepID=A0AAW1IGN8_SAPOF